jgi:hypothetical protein
LVGESGEVLKGDVLPHHREARPLYALGAPPEIGNSREGTGDLSEQIGTVSIAFDCSERLRGDSESVSAGTTIHAKSDQSLCRGRLVRRRDKGMEGDMGLVIGGEGGEVRVEREEV